MINNILGKKVHSIKLLGKKKNDFDSDGIHNKKDCQPFNIMRQDRLRAKPINSFIKDDEDAQVYKRRTAANAVREYIRDGYTSEEAIQIVKKRYNKLSSKDLKEIKDMNDYYG